MGHKYYIIRVLNPVVSKYPYTVAAKDKKEAERILAGRLGKKLIRIEYCTGWTQGCGVGSQE